MVTLGDGGVTGTLLFVAVPISLPEGAGGGTFVAVVSEEFGLPVGWLGLSWLDMKQSP